MNTFFGTVIVISGRGKDGAQRDRDIQTDSITTNRKRLICNIKAIPSVSFDADYRLVVAKVRLTAPPKKSRREYRKFNVEKLNNKAVVEHLQIRISEKIERTEPSDEA